MLVTDKPKNVSNLKTLTKFVLSLSNFHQVNIIERSMNIYTNNRLVLLNPSWYLNTIFIWYNSVNIFSFMDLVKIREV